MDGNGGGWEGGILEEAVVYYGAALRHGGGVSFGLRHFIDGRLALSGTAVWRCGRDPRSKRDTLTHTHRYPLYHATAALSPFSPPPWHRNAYVGTTVRMLHFMAAGIAGRTEATTQIIACASTAANAARRPSSNRTIAHCVRGLQNL